MKKMMMACAAGLLSLGVHAQDDAAPAAAEAAPNAFATLEDRWYLSPSVFWAFADGGRDTDDGLGASIAVGRSFFTPELVLEGFAQFNEFDHEQGNDTADLIGLGINSLFFPTNKVPAYLLLGAGYGDVSSHPGGDEDYSTFLLNVGGGYWWKRFDIGFIKGASLRTDAIWRLDAHNDRRTGDTEDNGRKAFQDILLSVGLMLPIGEVAAPPPTLSRKVL
jgi:OmpA-OmpF porin, OOP family